MSQVSFETPEYTANADALGTLRLLEAIRILGIEEQDALLSGLDLGALRQGAGDAAERDDAVLSAHRPMRAAKLYAYWITVNYREAYGMHASNGILFNHESPMRGETFVTRKITRAVAAIELGLQDRLYLGNLDAKRDWGHARDYVEGMWLMLQQRRARRLRAGDRRDAHACASSSSAPSPRSAATIDWRGKGVDEKGVDAKTGQVLVEVDPRYFRPTEVDILCGDASKARDKLGWKPKILFDDLVKEMVRHDVALLKGRRA